MKKITTLSITLCMLLFTHFVYSQNTINVNASLSKIAWVKAKSGHITFKPQVNIPGYSVFLNYKEEFGLSKNDEMRLIRADKDKKGMIHYRYQQFNNGFPVDGAVFLLHEKAGKVQSGNGKIIRGLKVAKTASILSSKALQKALTEVPSEKYIWQDATSEALLKEIKKDKNATYYPVPQLVVFDKKYSDNSENYTLAYKIEIYSLKPLARKYIFIDAVSGNVIHSINMIQNIDVPTTGVTKYNGNQQVTIDSVGPTSYRLHETGRGDGIITRSAQNGEDYNAAIDVIDDSTPFNSDDVAVSAHWAAEKTYDYYLNTFQRNSYDGNGAVLLSYVHFSVSYANAFWDGSKMTYGDGDSQYSPLTSIDICGHEITHAVTTSTANLVYQDESGALSEAFSDIFGACVEFYADATPNWTMGEDVGTPMRSLSNPGQYQNPDTYLGTYWDLDPNGMDNGGVHTNCGVGSYWFYLLSEGGSGNNDNGNAFSVTGLTRTVAEQIAYHTLAYYLTPSSNYYDTYQASLEAAEELYGACSNEVLQTANAWAAVGVGFPFDPQEIYVLDVVSPKTSCDLHSENVSLLLFYNGCNTSLPASDVIGLAYQFDGGSIEIGRAHV